MTRPFPLVPLDPAGLQRRIPLAPHQLVDRVTPQRDLFLLAHLGIPRLDPSSWRLAIDGLVERPRMLSLEEIHGLPKRRVESFHQCAGYPRRPDIATRRIANVVWGGADLATVLRAAGIRAEARFLWAYGVDHGAYEGVQADCYLKDAPLTRILESGALLAYEINGEALTLEHGGPLRLVIPGYYGTNAVKWLGRLELADRRAAGPFTTLFYNDPEPAAEGGTAGATRPVWEAPAESAIVTPAPGERLPRAAVEIWGWAWAAAGVAGVAISTDGGASWREAALEPRAQWSWQRFRLLWEPSAAGCFTLMARATDAAGRRQPASAARNAIHAVAVEVSPVSDPRPPRH